MVKPNKVEFNTIILIKDREKALFTLAVFYKLSKVKVVVGRIGLMKECIIL